MDRPDISFQNFYRMSANSIQNPEDGSPIYRMSAVYRTRKTGAQSTECLQTVYRTRKTGAQSTECLQTVYRTRKTRAQYETHQNIGTPHTISEKQWQSGHASHSSCLRTYISVRRRQTHRRFVTVVIKACYCEPVQSSSRHTNYRSTFYNVAYDSVFLLNLRNNKKPA